MIKSILSLLLLSGVATASMGRNGEVVGDSTTRLMWQDNIDAKTGKRTWQGAIEYCDALTLDSYTDWKLPSRDELLSITDDTKHNPAILNGFENVVSENYWSSSPNVSDASNAWYVNFKDGYDFWYDKSSTGLVRCVRDSR